MSDWLFDLLSPERPTAIVDVGASPIDGAPPYLRMLDSDICTVVGFEPQIKMLEALEGTRRPNETYLPHVIGDGAPANFHVCRSSGLSSLLRPDENRLLIFQNLTYYGEVVEILPCETKRLDDIAGIDAIDYLKIDIQGGELSVLKHARNSLSHAVVVQTEVSFFGIYEGQPTFGDVDAELREHGFAPHCFFQLNRWPLDFSGRNSVHYPESQLVDADVVYLRVFEQHDTLTTEQLKHMALVCFHCYGSIDVMLRCVDLLERRKALCANVANAIRVQAASRSHAL